MKKHLLCSISCVLIFFSLQAQVKGNPKLKTAPRQTPTEKTSSRLSEELQKLYENNQLDAQKAAPVDKPFLLNDALGKYMVIADDMVLVEITAKGDPTAAKAELEKAGLKIKAIYGRVISGMMPIDSLPKLDSIVNIKYVRPAYKAIHHSFTGNTPKNYDDHSHRLKPVISQGDTAQRSYLVRASRGRHRQTIDGKGVKVGILSDSYNHLGTAPIGVANGELPGPENPLGYKKPVQVLQDLDFDGTDEGRGMAEIIHDVAPGSEIAFRTAYLGQADYAQGIMELASAGCNIMVDDLSYLDEPFFQDGIIAQAIDSVKNSGVSYFSAAGNLGRLSYEYKYQPSKFMPFGPDFGTAHNFGAPGNDSIFYQPVFIPTNGTFLLSFQWDQPFFSAGGAGSESDLDIYLLDQDGNIVAASFDDNIKSGDPVELIGYINETTSNTFFIVITKYNGPDPSILKYVIFRDGAFYLTDPPIPGILAPTLIGHAKAAGAITTGAVFYGQTPAYGVKPPVVETFSSLGGVPNYFDKQGKRIAPLVRKKPEISAPDGGNTSFFPPDVLFGNQDITEDTDTFPNFFGTSAAAPHAAGAAALMIDAQRLNTITPDQIKGILSSNTVDMDNIYTNGFDKGFDFKTGFGLIKADAAVKEVKFPKKYIKDLQLKAICSADQGIQSWEVWNPNPFAVEAKWFLKDYSQNGVVEAQPGKTIFNTKTERSYYRNAQTVAVLFWKDNFSIPHFDIAHRNHLQCDKYLLAENNQTAYAPVINNKEEKSSGFVQVLPNPSKENFTLNLNFSLKEKVEIELYSTDGRQLMKKVASGQGTIQLITRNYKPGIYILKIRQGAFIQTIKLAKQ